MEHIVGRSPDKYMRTYLAQAKVRETVLELQVYGLALDVAERLAVQYARGIITEWTLGYWKAHSAEANAQRVIRTWA